MSHDSVLNFLLREDYCPADLFARVSVTLDLVGGTLSVDDSIWDKPYSNPALNALIGRHYPPPFRIWNKCIALSDLQSDSTPNAIFKCCRI
jgi:hypothetical protein